MVFRLRVLAITDLIFEGAKTYFFMIFMSKISSIFKNWHKFKRKYPCFSEGVMVLRLRVLAIIDLIFEGAETYFLMIFINKIPNY